MRVSHIGVAMWLMTGSQFATAVPTSELLDVLQSRGEQNLNARDLSAMLQNLASSSAQLQGQQGAAALGQGQEVREADAESQASADSADSKASGAAKGGQAAGGAQAGNGVQAGNGAQAGNGTQAGNGGQAAEGGGEAGNEVNISGTFGTATALQGGNLKQDVQFTKTTVGSFEFEFQNAAADSVTVTENKTPAAPPTGFEALEKSSFKVALATSKGAGLALSKIDFIFDTAAAGVQGKDITKAQVGKLCTDTGAFTISETLGELEFELEENEVSLKLTKNVTAEGEWGIFLPVAPAGASAGNQAAAAA